MILNENKHRMQTIGQLHRHSYISVSMDTVLALNVVLALDKCYQNRKKVLDWKMFLRKQTFGHAMVLDKLHIDMKVQHVMKSNGSCS